ncbi:MAG: phage replisome organizer N-terminal domain-containing protein, partial [Acholeplasmatales bacterium]|nr:phage replisome organizer N-terminal domain-containing protein [Acholeplasmatales bacterium]
MAANDNKRYYWLKLNKNFFKQHEIIIIEGMPNGKEYLILYLKLLAESVSHEGDLRFSGKIPYSDSMLATLTNTNIDIVRSALKIFSELHMIEIQDDGTIHMNETENMIGSETGNAARKREYRERLKGEEQKLLGDNDGTSGGHCPQEIRDKSIENRYIDKLINDKPRNAHEETSNFNLFPNSYEERQALKEELTNRNLDIAEFYLMHNLVKSYYFNRAFNLE